MKLIIFFENNAAGGLDTFITQLIKNWPKNRSNITVIGNASHPGFAELERELADLASVIKHRIPLNWHLSNLIGGALPMVFRRCLGLLFRYMLMPLQYFWLRRILDQTNGDNLIVVNGSYPGGETCRLASIVWGHLGKAKSIHNFHNFAAKPRYGFSILENFIDSRVIDQCSHFVSVSETCSSSIRVRPKFKNLENITTIYNGVKINNVGEQPATDIRQLIRNCRAGDIILLTLGTFEARKGHEFIFKALQLAIANRTDVHYVICGHSEPQDFGRIKKIRSKYRDVLNVHILPFLANGASIVSQVDCLLIGSQHSESFGLTALEAMLQNVPVVSTNVGGLAEVLGVDGETALIVEPHDHVGFANRLNDLLVSEKVRLKITAQGYEFASNNFNANKMASSYANLLGGTMV